MTEGIRHAPSRSVLKAPRVGRTTAHAHLRPPEDDLECAETSRLPTCEKRLARSRPSRGCDEAWGTVNSTVSRPFPKPKSGKVAIKVINHYGDEVMKVVAA